MHRTKRITCGKAATGRQAEADEGEEGAAFETEIEEGGRRGRPRYGGRRGIDRAPSGGEAGIGNMRGTPVCCGWRYGESGSDGGHHITICL